MSITSLYLPKEGLQGERIPSHILWQGLNVVRIEIKVPEPFEIKDVYNSDSWLFNNNKLVIKDIIWDGYIGLSFQSNKVSEITKKFSFEYFIYLSDGSVSRVTKNIILFRPQISVEKIYKEITVDPLKRSVRNKITIKNKGRGCLIISITSSTNSQVKLFVKDDVKVFMKNFANDLKEEIEILKIQYPRFEGILNEYLIWMDVDIFSFNKDNKEKFIDYVNRFKNIVYSETEFLNAYIDSFIKVFIKNFEILKQVERFIRNFESLISKELVMVNPFDELMIKEGKQNLELIIKQTDKILDDYEEMIMPNIVINGINEGNIPLYYLFDKGVHFERK